MPFDPRTDRLPTEYELEERDRLLDQLLDWLRREGDPDEAIRAVQTLADEAGVHIAILADDPVTRANVLGDDWVTAVWVAGRDPEAQASVSMTAIGKVKELEEVLGWWREEARERNATR